MNLAQIWIGTLISAVANISEPVRTAVKSTVVELDKKAKQTPNPWDNIFVNFLAGILGVELEDQEAIEGVSAGQRHTPADPRNGNKKKE